MWSRIAFLWDVADSDIKEEWNRQPQNIDVPKLAREISRTHMKRIIKIT